MLPKVVFTCYLLKLKYIHTAIASCKIWLHIQNLTSALLGRSSIYLTIPPFPHSIQSFFCHYCHFDSSPLTLVSL